MQQHPNLLLNKIKFKSYSSLWSCGWCTCCQPHPYSDLFAKCAVISNKENRTSVPEKFERNSMRIQAGWPKPGRPAYICHQIGQGNLPRTDYTEPARLQKGHGDWPQGQAGRPSLGWPAPPVSLSPRLFSWCWFNPSTTLSFLLSFKFTLIKFK